jgi:hypothetical protein
MTQVIAGNAMLVLSELVEPLTKAMDIVSAGCAHNNTQLRTLVRSADVGPHAPRQPTCAHVEPFTAREQLTHHSWIHL